MDQSRSLTQETYSAFSNSIHSKLLEKNIPIDGTIELTQRCNLRCAHCYCCPDASKHELSTKEVCRILDEVADAGCLWLLITGGEPLLRPDFLNIYRHAKNKGFLITLFTNATLLTEKIVDAIMDYPPFFIEVSIYGATSRTYEKVTCVEGSFDACMRGIRLILDRKLPLKLKTVAMRGNSHEIGLMKDLSARLGCEFRFDAMIHQKLDGGKSPIDMRLSPMEAVALDVADEEKLDAWREVCKSPRTSGERDKLFNCGGGKNGFHIDPHGILRPCDMLRDICRDLKISSFSAGWAGMVAEMPTYTVPVDYRCNSCSIKMVCNQCAGWALLEDKGLYGISEHMCAVALERNKKFNIAS